MAAPRPPAREPRRDGRSLAAAIADGEIARRTMLDAVVARRASLPLRYWRQQAHLTTPASDLALAKKAQLSGTASVRATLERLGLAATDVAECLELAPRLVEATLEHPRLAPLVMLDGEDSIVASQEAAVRAAEVIAHAFADPAVPDDGSGGLRFYRPPGFSLESSVRDLYAVLWKLREAVADPTRFPLDGIVFPKVEHPEEVDVLHRLLERAEDELDLEPGRIRVAYLVETGWAVTQLAEITRRAIPRLSGLIFGLADFSADLGLRSMSNAGTISDWARAEIVAAAGAAGVPAIDGMTLDYPVLDPGLDARANRHRWLDRIRLAFDDAVRARELGMLGKWVGHPAQLFVVLLAFEAAFDDAAIEHEAWKLEQYAAVVRAGRGATTIDGVMSDRATDRHARVLLRQATAVGRLEPARALDLGVIDVTELGDAQRAHGARSGVAT